MAQAVELALEFFSGEEALTKLFAAPHDDASLICHDK